MINSKVYKPSDLHASLKEWGLHAKKKLSQNFLIDGNIVQKIVDISDVGEKDFIVEIGAGPGALTQALLERGAQVLAIEMDAVLAKALDRLQTSDRRLEVVQNDILKFPLVQYLQKQARPKCKIVANLPYHITTPILTLLLPCFEHIESLTIMVQKEFADRMQAQKGTSLYSRFTLFLQFYATVKSSFAVSPNCFYPRPKVHSSVVHCKLHPPLLESGVEAFFQLIKTAFGQRRKMLRSSLKDLYGSEKVEQALFKLTGGGIRHSGEQRPEELSMDEFISLHQILFSV
jgi:16S rRNA (adenine1518-N6/adenine1519-N6)-dimethyltransferase